MKLRLNNLHPSFRTEAVNLIPYETLTNNPKLTKMIKALRNKKIWLAEPDDSEEFNQCTELSYQLKRILQLTIQDLPVNLYLGFKLYIGACSPHTKLGSALKSVNCAIQAQKECGWPNKADNIAQLGHETEDYIYNLEYGDEI